MADKALIDPCNSSLVVHEAVVTPVSVPGSVSEGWVQLNHVTLCREHKLARVTIHRVVRVE